MVLHEGSMFYEKLEDDYFDAPDLFGSYTEECIALYVKRLPFTCQQYGLEGKIKRAFAKNRVKLSECELEEILELIETRINLFALPASCLVLRDDRITYVVVSKGIGDDHITFSMHFDVMKTPLAEGVLEDRLSTVRISDLPANTMIYFRYPEVDGDGVKTPKVAREGSKGRYAMILAPDIAFGAKGKEYKDHRLVIKSTTKRRPYTVAIDQSDLGNINHFKRISRLNPKCLCYVDNDYRVARLADVVNTQKLAAVKQAVEGVKGGRELTALDADGTVELLSSPMIKDESVSCGESFDMVCSLLEEEIDTLAHSPTAGGRLVVLFD